MNKPAMMDWALRLLRLLNEKKFTSGRGGGFEVNIRTAQRTSLPCHLAVAWLLTRRSTPTRLISDYVITDKILKHLRDVPGVRPDRLRNPHFGKEHSKFLAGLKNRIFRMPDVYQMSRMRRSTWKKWQRSSSRWAAHQGREVISSFTDGREAVHRGAVQDPLPRRLLVPGGDARRNREEVPSRLHRRNSPHGADLGRSRSLSGRPCRTRRASGSRKRRRTA